MRFVFFFILIIDHENKELRKSPKNEKGIPDEKSFNVFIFNLI